MSAKEEKDRLRQERLAAQARQAKGDERRQRLALVGAGLIVLLIVAGLVAVIAGSGGDESTDASGETIGDSPENAHIEELSGSVNGFEGDGRLGTTPPAVEQADLELVAEEAGCELMLDLPDEGNAHIQLDDDPPDYKTNPPTSGAHIASNNQQADGAYAEYPDPKYTVHSLEHGRVTIQYSPELPEADQLAVKGVFDESFEGMLSFPNPEMPYEVAATAWQNMLGCETYEGRATLDAIRAFRDIYRGRGPEDVPLVLSG